MSLSWFPFNIKDFLANTKRLNTEAKGAYLCLMLDYYEQEAGPPDDDDVLASICELSPDAWKRHRKVIAPLFKIGDGYWHHERIDHEIEIGTAKLAQSKARAQAGAAAMHTKMGHKSARSKAQAVIEQKPPIIPAPSQPTAMLEQSPLAAHLQLHPSITEGEDAPPKDDSEGIGGPINSDFQPDEAAIERAHEQGATDAEIDSELRKFIAHHQERATFSANWNASWRKWWEGWKAHRDKLAKAAKPKAPPRVEVSSAPLNWAGFCDDWIKYQRWPSRGAGGHPGTVACRCPTEVMVAAGIDPATGLKPAPKWQPSPAKEPV